MTQPAQPHPLFADLQSVWNLADEAAVPGARNRAAFEAANRLAAFLAEALNPKPAETPADATAAAPGKAPVDDGDAVA